MGTETASLDDYSQRKKDFLRFPLSTIPAHTTIALHRKESFFASD